MVGDADEEADPDAVAALGPGEGSDEDLIHHRAGAKEEAAVERPAGHFDQGSSFWDEAESSAHEPIGRKKWPPLTNPVLSITSRHDFGVLRNFCESGGTSCEVFL